jgi:hypothetical protein
MNFEISKSKIKKNILFWYNISPLTGLNWYPDAFNYANELSNDFNLPLNKVVGIIAAFSPLKRWEQNKHIAKIFLTGPSLNGLHFTSLQLKAMNILYHCTTDSDILNELNGIKIQAFFTNILNVNQCKTVTIDRHIINLCIPTAKQSTTITKVQYTYLAKCLVECSKKLNITPAQLQAVIWVNYKNNPLIKKQFKTVK